MLARIGAFVVIHLFVGGVAMGVYYANTQPIERLEVMQAAK